MGGKSLLDCVVFGCVTGAACVRYVLGDQGESISLAALAGGVSVEGTKSDQAILVGGGWACTSAANTEVENDGSVVLLGHSTFCGGNSTVATGRINGVNTTISTRKEAAAAAGCHLRLRQRHRHWRNGVWNRRPK